MTVNTPPRIYVADLAAYNEGTLRGEWLTLEDDTADDIRDDIARHVLAPGHEEFAIHDFEGFGPIRIGEYDSIETVLAHVERMGDYPAKYFAWIEAHGENYADGFDEDKVSGPYDDAGAWFDDYIENSFGSLNLEDVLVAGGMDARTASGLAELLEFISPEQFELMMSCNAGVSFVAVRTGDYTHEFYEVRD